MTTIQDVHCRSEFKSYVTYKQSQLSQKTDEFGWLEQAAIELAKREFADKIINEIEEVANQLSKKGFLRRIFNALKLVARIITTIKKYRDVTR